MVVDCVLLFLDMGLLFGVFKYITFWMYGGTCDGYCGRIGWVCIAVLFRVISMYVLDQSLVDVNISPSFIFVSISS